MIAPVGQECWQGASSQCLQTSLIMSQRLCASPPIAVASSAICSLNATCRQVVRAEVTGVVVAVAGEFEPVDGKLVPLLARDLARLAADAERGVGEEPHDPFCVDADSSGCGTAVLFGGNALGKFSTSSLTASRSESRTLRPVERQFDECHRCANG